MAAAAVQNFNSPVYIEPPYNANGGPPLDVQTNNIMIQQPIYGLFNRAIFNRNAPAPSTIIGSERWTTLSSMVTMAPGAGRFADVKDFKRRNQNPRTMMDYAEAPYGNARGQLSKISWSFNTPQQLLTVNNSKAISRQRLRERTCLY